MTDSEIDSWFNSAPEDQRETLARTRRLITSLGPDVREELKWARPCYSSTREMFCYLQTTRKHATLGFQHGTSLTDPAKLLQGTGKDMRHVKLDLRPSADQAAIEDLLTQAYRNAC